jgi:hypothetical protein
MRRFTLYPLEWGFSLFMVYLFAWFLTMVVSMLMVNVVPQGEIIIYSVLYRFASLFLVVNVMFLIAELLCFMGYLTGGVVESHNAVDYYKSKKDSKRSWRV